MTQTPIVTEAMRRVDLNSLAENIAVSRSKNEQNIPTPEAAVRQALVGYEYDDAQIAEIVEHFEWMIGQHSSLSVQ